MHIHPHTHVHRHTLSRLSLLSLIPWALQGMKLTAEEFNAIFTFYDKVRGAQLWLGRQDAAPAGEPTDASGVARAVSFLPVPLDALQQLLLCGNTNGT